MTKLQSLNVFLTERLMLTAQEIYKVVEDTILEYKDELVKEKRENDKLKLKLREVGIIWTEREPCAALESEHERCHVIDQKEEVEAKPISSVEQECITRKKKDKQASNIKQKSTLSHHENGDSNSSLPKLPSNYSEVYSGEDSIYSTTRLIKTETDGFSVCPFNQGNELNTFSTLNTDYASVHSENSTSMIEENGLLDGFDGQQFPHSAHSLQMYDPALSCTVCGKVCRHLGHLNAHAQIHSKDKPFLCGICGKSFNSSGRLKGHQRIHTGEKPYQCHICMKRFNQTAHLKVHVRVHTGEKPFSCHVCGKSFSQSNKVKRHLITHLRN